MLLPFLLFLKIVSFQLSGGVELLLDGMDEDVPLGFPDLDDAGTRGSEEYVVPATQTHDGPVTVAVLLRGTVHALHKHFVAGIEDFDGLVSQSHENLCSVFIPVECRNLVGLLQRL